jgi:8-oxo-dGTP pyrophosphatase MutT (NUDIX family)
MSLPEHGLFAVESVEARLAPYDWAFARERSAEIEAVWARESAAKPRIYDGRVLLQHEGLIEDGVFRARYFETGYKQLLGWIRLGSPGPSMLNGFAMAALRGADGAFLLGEMGAHTTNAGRIYFAAGTPDLGDVMADGLVDLAGSVLRELEEETGLLPGEVVIDPGWTVVIEPGRAAFMRPIGLALTADEARNLMRARMAALPEQELADIVIIRSHDDVDANAGRMPGFMQRYLRHMFG